MVDQHHEVPVPQGHPGLLQEQRRPAASVQLRIADGITRYAGSMPFVYIHIARKVG